MSVRPQTFLWTVLALLWVAQTGLLLKLSAQQERWSADLVTLQSRVAQLEIAQDARMGAARRGRHSPRTDANPNGSDLPGRGSPVDVEVLPRASLLARLTVLQLNAARSLSAAQRSAVVKLLDSCVRQGSRVNGNLDKQIGLRVSGLLTVAQLAFLKENEARVESKSKELGRVLSEDPLSLVLEMQRYMRDGKYATAAE